MTQGMPDVIAHVKQFGLPYLGDLSGLAEGEVLARVRDLADTSPDAAREMVSKVSEGIDQSARGRYSGQLAQLEQMVGDELGVPMRS